MTECFSTKKLVLLVLFTALVCVATMSIRTPIPGTGDCIHPGDTIVILYGVFLNPVSTFLAAGVDSCMADLLEGYFIYVPIIFATKSLMTFSANHVCCGLKARGINPYAAAAGYGAIDIVLMARGYCMCEVFLYELGAALASVPNNIIQRASGLIISSALYPVLQKSLFMALKA